MKLSRRYSLEMEILELLGYFDISGSNGSQFLKLQFLKMGHMISVVSES